MPWLNSRKFFCTYGAKIIEEHENRRIEKKSKFPKLQVGFCQESTRGPNKKGISTLGRIAGKVAPSQTTLSRAIGPFAERKMVTFEYKNAATTVSSANLLQLSVLLNSVYDFDKSSGNYFGNKQSLYYDQLLSASGPYKNYKVIG